jgi:hypothetical protein
MIVAVLEPAISPLLRWWLDRPNAFGAPPSSWHGVRWSLIGAAILMLALSIEDRPFDIVSARDAQGDE